MGDLPLPPSSASGLLTHDPAVTRSSFDEPNSSSASDNLALLDVLRQAVNAGTFSTDALLNAVADAARVVSGADGTAVASRLNGLVVCRARSGVIAPDLGAPVNADSGISGECLRTAAVLICKDTATDERVDPEVCRGLGIRSLAVVPLRGRMGILGILEAFSSRPEAFEGEQIDALRSLAEIAEAAYQREQSAPAPTPAVSRPALFAAPVASAADKGVRLTAKHYWIIGTVALAMLLITLVVRMSWRQAGADIAASEPHPQTVSAAENAGLGLPPRQVALKPDPTIVVHSTAVRSIERAPSQNVVRNAAELEPAADTARTAATVSKKSSAPDTAAQPIAPAKPEVADSDSPPNIQLAAANMPEDLSHLPSGSVPLPSFGAPVSKGVVEANLIRKVNPIYPPRARVERLEGSVILDAAIGTDGSVHKISVVSGPAMLANAAANAVYQWQYRPALLNGKPVETQKQITLVFKLP